MNSNGWTSVSPGSGAASTGSGAAGGGTPTVPQAYQQQFPPSRPITRIGAAAPSRNNVKTTPKPTIFTPALRVLEQFFSQEQPHGSSQGRGILYKDPKPPAAPAVAPAPAAAPAPAPAPRFGVRHNNNNNNNGYNPIANTLVGGRRSRKARKSKSKKSKKSRAAKSKSKSKKSKKSNRK